MNTDDDFRVTELCYAKSGRDGGDLLERHNDRTIGRVRRLGGAQFFPGLRIPNPHGLVIGCAGELFPIGRLCHAKETILGPGQDLPNLKTRGFSMV